jgi:tight adherence protein B
MDRVDTLQGIVLLLAATALLFGAWTIRDGRRERALKRRLASVAAADAQPAGEADTPDITGRRHLGPADRIKALLSRFYARRQTVFLPPGIRLWRTLVVGSLVAGLVWGAAGPLLGRTLALLLASVSLAVVPRFVFAASRRKTLEAILQQLPDAIGLVVRATRAGIPVSESLRMVSAELGEPIAPLFRRIVDETAVGTDLDTVLERASASVRLPEFRFFVVTLALQRETGGNLTEVLDNLADTIRQRRRVALKGRSLSAEARASALVLAALPFVAGGGLLMLNPDYVRRLADDATGNLLLAAAGGLLLAGIGSMHVLIRRTLS